jgi:putative hemolysin
MIGTYSVRRAADARDMAQAMALRRARFGVGEDDLDAGASQMMVMQGAQVLATFRMTEFARGADMARSYSAQFYDLTGFAQMTRPSIELGRFCMQENAPADVLRLAFAAMARKVDEIGAALLFGCASFQGCDSARHLPSLALLREHIGQGAAQLSRDVIDIKQLSIPQDRVAALRAMPPLLRSYLALGGKVSDHAVQDWGFGTLHVFTAVGVNAIPAPRAAALRALAAQIELG